jgi:uridine kinase
MSKLLGITGRSCSGKSTLALELHNKLSDSVHIDIDDFFDYAADFNCATPGELELKSMKDITSALQKLKKSKDAHLYKYDFKNTIKSSHSIISSSNINEASVL